MAWSSFKKNVFSVTSICRIHNLKDFYVKGHRRNTLEDIYNTHKRTHKVTYKQKKFYRHILDKIKFVLKSLDDAKSQVSTRGEPRNPVNFCCKSLHHRCLQGILATYTEAATGGVLEEELLLEISQNSQENTCAKVSF